MKKAISPLISFIVLLMLVLPISSIQGNGGVRQTATVDSFPMTQRIVYLPVVVRDYISLPPVIPSTTHVLTETTTQYLSSVSPNGEVFTFTQTTPALESIAPGDIIVSEPIPAAPYGLLRKVVYLDYLDDTVVLWTESATLEDAIQQGVGYLSHILTPGEVLTSTFAKGVVQRLTPQAITQSNFYLDLSGVVLYDDDGDLSTTNDQIVANGSITFEPIFDFRIVVQNWQVRRINFVSRVHETSDIQIEASVNLSEVEHSIEVARYIFKPIPVMIGVFPIVVIPTLAVNIGIDGSVSVGISTGVTQEAILTAGLNYINGGWSPVSSLRNNFQYNLPTVSTGLNLMGYTSLELSLLLYGAIGPYVEVKAYLELVADPMAYPWWKLYGGLDVPIGVEVEILGRTLADYSTIAVSYKVLLAQAPSRIAFVSDRDGNEEIYWIFSDGRGEENLTKHPANDGHPSWAPSGNMLVFHSNRISPDNYEIFSMNLESGVIKRLTNNPGWDGQPEWSPDGNKIAFESLRTGIFEIFVMNSDGTNVVNLTRGQSGGYPAWSPDGTQIAFHSARSGRYQIYVVNADGSGLRQITNHPSDNCMPRWSPDGAYIVFSSNRNGNWDIFRVNIDGTNLLQLTSEPYDEWWPVSFSPDGTKIAFVSNKYGNWDIFIMNENGTGITRLTNNDSQDWWPAWSPSRR